MADNVDNMSAAELRTKLAEYGLPVMPITASTRNLLVKKLKMAMEGKNIVKNADGRRSLALSKYSSGEDSDMDGSKTAKEKAKTRRTIAGGTMLPPVTNKLRKSTPKKSDSPAKNDDKDSESETEPIKTHEEVKTVTTRRITRTFKTPSTVEQEEYETGSDSDIDNKTSSVPTYKTSFISTAQPYKSVSRDFSISSTLPPATTSRDSIINPSYSSYTSSSDLNSIRSRLGLTQNYGDKPSLGSSYTSTYSSSNYKPTVATEEIDSPYLSSFTRRLSSLKTTDISRNTLKDTDSTNGNNSYTGKSFYKSNYKRREDYSPDFKVAGEKNIFKTNLVSLSIVGVVLAFFLGLSFLYVGMKDDAALYIEDKNIVVPFCHTMADEKPLENCIKKDDLVYAKTLLNKIYPELNSRAIAKKCGETSERSYMTDNEIIEFAEKSNAFPPGHDILELLHSTQFLIVHNPKYGISVIEVDRSSETTELKSMDHVINRRKNGLTGLEFLNPSIPWTRNAKRIFFQSFWVVLVLGVIASLAFIVHRAIDAYRAQNKKRKDQIYSMVEQIIDVLSQENSEEGVNSAGQAIAVSHVRDTLISPQNREKMADIWDAAIDFLEKNESRVRFEVERVSGEEHRVLRWVSPQGSPRARGPGAKAWQGQAFETQEGSVNNLAVSPTPCLKIRHMVDKNDKNPNLKNVVQEAILEKCGPSCRILHMEIDKVSCCVYVKCASPADAGIVYQNLHGWWYEGNLITVKYLRLERYMDHFPNSPSTGPYLKSSNQ